jgi:hypothetical protein
MFWSLEKAAAFLEELKRQQANIGWTFLAGDRLLHGEPTGGWFWLPPISLWQSWARKGHESVAKRMALKGRFLDEIG